MCNEEAKRGKICILNLYITVPLLAGVNFQHSATLAKGMAFCLQYTISLCVLSLFLNSITSCLIWLWRLFQSMFFPFSELINIMSNLVMEISLGRKWVCLV